MPTGTGCDKCQHLHDDDPKTYCTCSCHKQRSELAEKYAKKDDTGER